jgi:hypothetical protein
VLSGSEVRRQSGEDERRQANARAPQLDRSAAQDADNDGVIIRSEWRGTDEAFREQDTNRDGVLSGSEIRWLETAATSGRDETARASQRERLNTRFSRLDTDNDGRLERREWTDDEAAFDRADPNHDGAVTRTEFLQYAPIRTGPRQPTEAASAATRAYQAGYDRGLTEGRQAGKEDRNVNGGKWDLEGQRELEQADSGFDARIGAREDYQAGYRAGFRLGYKEGFGPR